jgi:hypothetical protein
MDLLSYSKEREPEYEYCHPNEIADDVCELLDTVGQENDVTLVKQFSQRVKTRFSRPAYNPPLPDEPGDKCHRCVYL